ncbi:threonine/serine exporter family protein [Desulfovibrio sp. OttesenSCG-928-G15]|nr:threonine/serine exporter family protein [Desulfovibrio sp. OttesenSCG-928-G15]
MPHTLLQDAPARERMPDGFDPQCVDFEELCAFLHEFVTTMLSMGSQTARMVRSAKRIADVFGADIEMLVLFKHAVVTISSRLDKKLCKTVVIPFRQIGLNFDLSYRLNRLSWELSDSLPAQNAPGATGNEALHTVRRQFYELLQRPRLSHIALCVMIGVASAAFCRLFRGDLYSMAVVFVASQAAFATRYWMLKNALDTRMAFFTAAFVSSFLTALAIVRLPSATPSVAVAASVLFLVPGVPLLNAVNDFIDGYTLMGISRGVHASILILCVGFGLATSILLTGFNVL